MISIILPFYNSETYLENCIDSVLAQSYEDWELILINDGSIDRSKEIIVQYEDSRISYFEQKNTGVSAARNIGLKKMKGDYFCFLDSDDFLTTNSLSDRLFVFRKNPNINFVDGVVFKKDPEMDQIEQEWDPKLIGNPLVDLVRLGGKSFFGPTWLIKRDRTIHYEMNENLSHGEDLLFYMDLARKGGQYAFTNQVILWYRNTPNSAMKDIRGLERGYRKIESIIKDWPELDSKDLEIYRRKYKKSLFLAYLTLLKPFTALKAILR